MKYIALAISLLAFAFVGMLAPARASAPSTIDHGGTYWGDHTVAADQEVEGNITVFNGDLDVAGTVDGNVDVYGGNIVREPGSVISGESNEYPGPGNVSSFVPWFGARTLAHENAKMMTLLAYSVIVVLMFLIFPVRVRKALDRVEHHPGLSAAVGVLAIVASVPIAILLFISFVGWPLLPIEVVAYVAGVLIGQAALGVLVGRRLFELVRPHETPSPLAALVLGLVVICAAEILPIVGWMVTALVWLVGLGAAILAFVRDTTFMSGAGPQSGPRPTISGPPMTA